MAFHTNCFSKSSHQICVMPHVEIVIYSKLCNISFSLLNVLSNNDCILGINNLMFLSPAVQAVFVVPGIKYHPNLSW